MKKIFFFALTIILARNSEAQNVGIGTTTPTDKLSIVNSNPGYGISHSYGPVTMGTYISNLNAQFGTKTNHPLQFFTNNGNAQVTLLQNGNFGIGTTSPGYKLTIVTQPGFLGFVHTDGTASVGSYVNGVSGQYGTLSDHPLQFFTFGGLPHVTLLQNGNFGIGSTVPQTKLHVNPHGAGSILIGSDKATGGYTNLEMGISAQSGGYSYIQSTQASGSTWGTLALNPWGGDITAGGKVGIAGEVTIAGRVGIGTNTPFSPLDIIQPANGSQAFRILEPGNIWGFDVYGNFFFDYNAFTVAGIDRNDGTYFSVSDRRLKKNITEIPPVLDKILQLSAKKYQFIAAVDPSKYSTGFISQEVKELFPEFVNEFKRNTKDSTLYYGINYAGFSVIAIKAIQEQQQQIEAANEKSKVMMELIVAMQLEIAALKNKK